MDKILTPDIQIKFIFGYTIIKNVQIDNYLDSPKIQNSVQISGVCSDNMNYARP